MTTLLSPGIETKETNLSATISNASTGRGAIVGKFEWGPAYQITQVTNESELVDVFGSSNDYTYSSFMNANNFLKYANDLRVVRIVNEDIARNATAVNKSINYVINTSAHSGYKVGDEITVSFGSTVVTAANKGRVTSIGTNGIITGVYIPSAEIIADQATRGVADLSGYTTVVSTANGGSGASITISLSTDSLVYFPNEDYAQDVMEASDATDFKAVSAKLSLPTLSALYPGAMGNDIKVHVCNKADFDSSITPAPGKTANGNVSLEIYPNGGKETVNFKSYFQFGPQNTNQYAIIVKIGDVVAETHIVSTSETDKDSNGETIFIDDYFQANASQYIFATVSGWLDKSASYVLSGGIDTGANASDWTLGWDLLSDPETLNVNLLIAGNVADESVEIASTVQKYAVAIVEARRDATLFCSPPKSLVLNKLATVAVANMVAWRSGVDDQGAVQDNNLNINSTYTVLDGNYKYQYDKYSDKSRWVPLAGDIAGLCAYTDQVGQPWMSPAGFNRGQIRNAIKLAVDTRQGHRDSLYEIAINPVVSFSGMGIVLYGDKTSTTQASAFDRINVRRLFNLLKRAISESAKYKLFELNDAFTRSSFKSEVDAYLDNIRALGGIYDFRVVCDESNNTGVVIDRNEFIASIYIKPARSINYITLNFIATSTGADFSEIIG